MAFFGSKWGGDSPGSGGGVVTWSFAQSGGRLLPFSATIPPGNLTDAIFEAFESWEAVADIDFRQVPDAEDNPADIRLALGDIDGPGGYVGKAQFQALNGIIQTAEIVFDMSETWSVSAFPNDDRYDFSFATAVHEIGHAIGLAHVSDPLSVMHPTVRYPFFGLSESDGASLAALYGEKSSVGPLPASATAYALHWLGYIAANADLIAAVGVDAEAGMRHWHGNGRFEGRETTFSPLEYIASHSDLMAGFGTDSLRATVHFIAHGWHEGRVVSFDALEYIASHDDLIAAFGSNVEAGAQHYITSGRNEGRTASFGGLEYIASYGDLIAAFGADAEAGAFHFIDFGSDEGRSSSFDGVQYIASHADLIAAFGAEQDQGSRHFIGFGQGEGRLADAFDEVQYLANYADLRAAFGSDTEAATVHYIAFGFDEGRVDDFLGT
jgi:hypothetical protein